MNREVPVVKRIERINQFPVGEIIKITEQIPYSFEVKKLESGEWEIISISTTERIGDKLSINVLALKFPAVFTRIIQDEAEPEPRKRSNQQSRLKTIDDDIGGEL